MKKRLTLMALLVSVSALAQQARVDVMAPDGKVLTPGTKSAGCGLSNPGWEKDEARKNARIYFASPRLKDEWQEVEFSFTPSMDGKVTFRVGGQWHNAKKGAKPSYAYVKEVDIVEGATLLNGTFEKKNADGDPANWSFNKKGATPPEFSEEDGATIVRMQYAGGITQKIDVTKDQMVKVKLLVKNGQLEAE